MAQLISFQGFFPNTPPLGYAPQPYVPAFQFWGTRNTGPLGLTIPFQASQEQFGRGFSRMPIAFLTCVNNVAHNIVGKIFTLFIAGNPTGVTFEYTDGGPVTPGNVPVTVANGDTAAQVAAKTVTAIQSWQAAGNFPVAFFANLDAPGSVRVEFVAFDASIPIRLTSADLAVSGNNAQPYGDTLLHRAWRAFVFNNVDPLGLSVFETGKESIGLGIWPLVGMRCFPRQFNPIVSTPLVE